MPFAYANPVWPDYLADPFVLKCGEDYFAFGTGGPRNGGLQPDGRMFPVLHSTDLVHWTFLGGALEPLGDPDRPAYWAPEVAERHGTWLLYYSAGGMQGEGHQLRVAASPRPEGPYTDTGRVLLPDEPFSIDAHPFRDPRDGRWHLFFAKDYLDADRPGTGLAVVPLEDDMTTPAGPVTPVVGALADWQIFQRRRIWYGREWPAWHTVEGPFVVFHAGRFWCLYSGGRWETADYGVGFAVADHPLGPWRDESAARGPTVLRGSDSVLGPGHCCVAAGPEGTGDFLVYHAWDRERTGRRMFIDPLVWTEEGPRCDGPSIGPRTVG